MLTDSLDTLLESDMFKGTIVYGHPIDRKPWYGYLYIAKFVERNKLKIGISADYTARDDQLKRKTDTQDSGKIIYLWSLPINAEIESKVKILLSHFTRRYSKETGKTEIFFSIPLYPFILVVRLIILFIFLRKGYITEPTERGQEILNVLTQYLNSVRIDGIKYGNAVYKRQDNLSSEPRIRKIRKAVKDAQELVRKYKGRSFHLGYLEVEDFIQNTLINDLNLDIDMPTGKNPQRKEWLVAWLDKYTTNKEPNNLALKPTEAEQQELETNHTFRKGDIVWVTFADTAENRDQYPEDWLGKPWHARIIKYETKGEGQDKRDGYRVEWLGDGWEGATTRIPAAWIDLNKEKIRHDGEDINRILDVLKIYKDIGVSTEITALREGRETDEYFSSQDTDITTEVSIKLKL